MQLVKKGYASTIFRQFSTLRCQLAAAPAAADPYQPLLGHFGQHGPQLLLGQGEIGRPGYGLYDRALGATYLNGLWEAIEKSTEKEETL